MRGLRLRILAERTRRLVRPLGAPEGTIAAPQLESTDVFLVSYPRSGNTMLRVILAALLYPKRPLRALSELSWLVPDIHFLVPIHHEYSAPRVIKTHRPFPSRHEAGRPELYGRFIYCVRHPVQAIASYYDFVLGAGLHEQKPPSFGEFVEQVLSGAEAYGSWEQHVLSWMWAAQTRNAHFLRYEDLVKDPAQEIAKLARHLGVDDGPQDVTRAVRASSREAMVELERHGSLVNQGYDFVRRAGTARGTATVTPELRQLICDRSRLAMERWRYTP